MATTLTLTGPAGTFTTDPNACWFEIHRIGILGGLNTLIKIRNVWTINGWVSALTPGAVDAKVLALENTIAEGMDVVFSLGSSMRLISMNTAEGTHIKEFRWLQGFDGVNGSGAEGVLRRTFRLVVYGDVLNTTGPTNITSWQETLSVIGSGGPRIIPVGSLSGGVQAQQVQAQTPFYILQSGFATGLTDYPIAPTPIYNGFSSVYYIPESMQSHKITPKNWGMNQNTNFGVRWSYKAWTSNSALGGSPVLYS